MEYFLITKTDNKRKLSKPLKLFGGYSFNQKISITIYNYNIIRYILLKKLNNSLKSIINSYILFEQDEDSDASALLPKLETLRNIFIEKYAFYLTESEIESYLMKIDRITEKVSANNVRKSRSL